MTVATRRCLRGLINLEITAEKEAEAATLLAPLPDPRPLIFCVARGVSGSPTGASVHLGGSFPVCCLCGSSDRQRPAASLQRRSELAALAAFGLVRARRIWA